MNILFFGDIMGKPGRRALAQVLPKLQKKHHPDLIVVNGENLAHGIGITERTIRDLLNSKVDIITSGNHIFDKKEGIPLLDDPMLSIVRPANYPPDVPGRGYLTTEVKDKKILVINLLGRVFFSEDFDCPFRKAQEIISQNPADIILVDFHSEATSEKRSLGFYLDGKVTVFVGTHTHVPTADAQILPQGTAYISDVGMVGIKHSVIGVEKKAIIESFLNQLPHQMDIPESGLCVVNGVLIKINDQTNRAEAIQPINEEVDI